MEFNLSNNIGNPSFQLNMNNSFLDLFNKFLFNEFYLNNLNCYKTAN